MIKPSARVAIQAVLVGLTAWAAAACIVKDAGHAWDFQTFYNAAVAMRHGVSPYPGAATGADPHRVVLPFLYPVATLALFVPFTYFPLGIAAQLWLTFKLTIAVALIVVWKRAFLREVSLALVFAVACFGFNAAILWDLKTGNVSILEQLLLWLAFACYVRDRRMAFALLVASASVFKLVSIVFLALLLVPSRKGGRRIEPALLGAAVFAGLVFAPSLLGVEWARGFLTSFPANRPFGEVNPCALGLFDILLRKGDWAFATWRSGTGTRTLTPGVPDLAIELWALYVLILIVASWKVIMRAWTERDPMRTVVTATMLFGLLSPRLMVYSYLLLIVPALLVVRGLTHQARLRALGMGLVLLQGIFYGVQHLLPLRIPWTSYPVAVFAMTLSFSVALGLWVLVIVQRGAWNGEPPATARDDIPPAGSRRTRDWPPVRGAARA